MAKTITIVGGGLAGLTLGLGLRQRGIPVVLWEAGHYPRHRVCGEFISGSGQSSLARLGLLPGLEKEGLAAKNVAFFAGPSAGPAQPLPQTALSISRFVLDSWLAGKFQARGGELRAGARWTSDCGAGVVRATGRQAKTTAQGWRWFGLKAHARGLTLAADLEMHFVPAGYVGLCRLPNAEVNICGLFRSQGPVPGLSQQWREWLGGAAGSVLHSRLGTAQMDENSFCAVAGISLRPEQAQSRLECCIGDAITMIPPVTGNGMSMAFESAELALDPLTRFSEGKLSWNEARAEVARRCDEHFARRLRSAALLQSVLFNSLGRSALLYLATHCGWMWRGFFNATR